MDFIDPTKTYILICASLSSTKATSPIYYQWPQVLKSQIYSYQLKNLKKKPHLKLKKVSSVCVDKYFGIQLLIKHLLNFLDTLYSNLSIFVLLVQMQRCMIYKLHYIDANLCFFMDEFIICDYLTHKVTTNLFFAFNMKIGIQDFTILDPLQILDLNNLVCDSFM